MLASVVDNKDAGRFELAVDRYLAELTYRRHGARLVLVHTEVPDALSGRGIGGVLVEAALARAAEEGLTVVPKCPFARSWLQDHPEAIKGATIDWQ